MHVCRDHAPMQQELPQGVMGVKKPLNRTPFRTVTMQGAWPNMHGNQAACYGSLQKDMRHVDLTDPFPEAQNSPKALYSMVFGPKSLIL